VLILGSTVVLVGVALVLLPGPAFVVIPIGLGILALEFAWARRWLRQARAFYEDSVHAPERAKSETGDVPQSRGP
jgi:uncharacterized protein (TIGR02611 family)